MSKRFLLYWLPLIIWICGIFVVSSIPGNPSPSLSPQVGASTHEYPLHITAFSCLYLLFYRLSNSNGNNSSLMTIMFSSLILTMVVAFSKECWQSLLPTRYFSLKDIFVDAGAAATAMLIVGSSRWARKRIDLRKWVENGQQ